MAKKKVSVTEQIKALIDKGDFVGAQALLNGEVQSIQNNSPAPPASKKKRGRPPKQNTSPPPPIVSPANNTNSRDSCIAPAQRDKSDGANRVVEKDGKTYTISHKVDWEPPKETNKFKDSANLAKREKLNYPEPSPRRDPAEMIEYICYLCNKKELLYQQGRDPDMLFTCERCMKRTRPK